MDGIVGDNKRQYLIAGHVVADDLEVVGKLRLNLMQRNRMLERFRPPCIRGQLQARLCQILLQARGPTAELRHSHRAVAACLLIVGRVAVAPQHVVVDRVQSHLNTLKAIGLSPLSAPSAASIWTTLEIRSTRARDLARSMRSKARRMASSSN